MLNIFLVLLGIINTSAAIAGTDKQEHICYIRGMPFECKNLAIATVQDINADDVLCYILYNKMPRFYCNDVRGYCEFGGEIGYWCEDECDRAFEKVRKGKPLGSYIEDRTDDWKLEAWCRSIIEDRRSKALEFRSKSITYKLFRFFEEAF